MKTRVITIPNGRQVTLGQYVEAWKKLKAMPPDAEVKGWQWYAVPARDILADFTRGVQDRINQHVPYMKRGAA